MHQNKHLQMIWDRFCKNKLNYIILIVIILAIFYQISLLIHPLKWDSISCCLPWRFTVGESISNGYFPWWNPYQSLGYPLHADMQITPWYLPVWIISLFTPYTLVVVQYEYLFHVVIAGIGMFWFLRTLKVDTIGCFIIAISYSLSGVLIGNAQHYHHITTAAWLPFVIGSFYHLLKSPIIKNILFFSLSSWFIVTGGYVGLVIVLVYALVLWTIFYLGYYYKINKTLDLRVLKACAIAFLLIVLLSLPQLISIFQSLPYFSKHNGIPLESALFGAFTPHSFISFILPYTTVKNSNWLGTDISMANIYFGICTLCLASLGLFHSNKIKWFILAIIIFSLIISLGKDTPFRAFLFHYVPLMNFSRFPAIYRIFSIFSFLMLAVLGWRLLAKDFDKYIKYFKRIVLFVFLLVLGFFIYYKLKANFSLRNFIVSAAFKDTQIIGYKQHLLFQSLIQMLILAVVWLLAVFCKNKKIWTRLFLLVVIVDFAIAVNLNAPYTVYSANGPSFSKLNKSKNKYEYGFNQTHNYKVCETDSICRSNFQSLLYENTSTLNKHVTPSAFTSFFLSDFEYIIDKQKTYLDSLIKNKVCFLTQDVRKMKYFNSDLKALNFASNTVYSDISNFKSLHNSNKGTVDNIKISPSEISMDVNSSNSSLLVLLQNYYPYWKVFVDGREQPIIVASKTFMAVNVFKETKQVVFKYKNNSVRYSFYISIFTLLLILIGLIYFRKKNNELLKK